MALRKEHVVQWKMKSLFHDSHKDCGCMDKYCLLAMNIVGTHKRKRVSILNKHGEKLVGILHETGSKELVIICHGFRSTKDCIPMVNLAAAFEKEGISAFRFDFAGNGESEGSFQYGNYRREADDLLSVVRHFQREKRLVAALVGHSKGKTEYRVTKESLMDRLTTDTCAACETIDKNCRVLTIHGFLDEMVPFNDAIEFAKHIPQHQLHIFKGTDHEFTLIQAELASLVLDFVKSGLPSFRQAERLNHFRL